MKAVAAFTLLAAAATASANVIPVHSENAPPYPLTTIATINPTAYPTAPTPTTYPVPEGTGIASYPPGVGTGGTGTGTGSWPNPTNGTYVPTGTPTQPTNGQTPPPGTTEIPISGASRNGAGLLALAGAAAAYVLS